MPTVRHIFLVRQVRGMPRQRRSKCPACERKAEASRTPQPSRAGVVGLNRPVYPLLKGVPGYLFGEKTMIRPASGKSANPAKTEGRRTMGGQVPPNPPYRPKAGTADVL